MTPGARLPARETVRAQFISDVVQGVDETRRSWMEEVQQDDLDKVMKLYTAEAVVIPPGGLPQKGTEAVRAFWEATLPRIGSVEAGMIDVDASGQMAMVAGSYSMEWRLPTGSSVRESGGLLTVYVRNGKRWLIRAQVFGGEIPAALEPETGGGGQPD
ncbi:MAG: DUF4440 domain-containing protein [Longimicrobiales bacterium]|nr:DUF4440 domain-containing protein [Longimicrobiales bacterium]